MFVFLGDDAHLETMWFLEKDIFRLVTSVGQKKKILSPHEESNLRPSMLCHRATDSSVSEVYYEVHMTRVPHTRRMTYFSISFVLSRNKTKNIYLYFFTALKTYNLSYYMFTYNLASIDIATAAMNMPLWIASLYTGTWNFGQVWCQLCGSVFLFWFMPPYLR